MRAPLTGRRTARAIEQKDFVLLAASAAYKQRWEDFGTTRTGAGAAREANVLKALFDRDQTVFFEKVIVVVLPGARDADIPNELAAGLPRFVIPEIDKRHLEDLLRRLTGQPAFVPVPLAQVPILPPAIMDPLRTAEASGDRVADEEVASDLKRASASRRGGEREPQGHDAAVRVGARR